MTVALALPHLDNATRIASSAEPTAIDPLRLPYIFPVPQPVAVRDLRAAALAILDLTGWSRRRLASALGTTHPTVAGILDGRAEGWLWRNAGYRHRLREMNAVVERISAIAGGDRILVRRLLANPAQGGRAIDHMAAGRFDDAYLAAIEPLRQSRPTGLITGRRPRAEDAPVALDDID